MGKELSKKKNHKHNRQKVNVAQSNVWSTTGEVIPCVGHGVEHHVTTVFFAQELVGEL